MVVSALLIRSLSLIFRVYLSGAVGAEGIGLIQLVLSVYLVYATVSSSGITLCATRLFTDYAAAGNPGAGRTCVEKCMCFAFLSGEVLCVLMLTTADLTASVLLQDVRTSPALRLLAPSLPFLAVSACIRGYFCARRKTVPTSSEQLLEQLSEIGVFILLLKIHPPGNISEACSLAVTGTTAAEILSFFYSLWWFRRDIHHVGCHREKIRGFRQQMLPILLPVTANACLRSGLSAAENALIPSGLQRSGMTETEALGQYGILSGMTLPLMVFPSVLILPFAVLIVPEISEAVMNRRRKEIRCLTEKMVSSTLRYSIPVTVIFFFFGESICSLLYHRPEAGKALSLLSPVIPFMYLDSVVDGILKGLNEQTSYFVFNTIDSILRVLMTMLLVPLWGLNGMLTVIIVSELLNTLLSLGRLIHLTEFRIPLRSSLLLPLFGMGLPCFLAQKLPSLCTPPVDLLLKLGCCFLFYGLLLFILRALPSNSHQGCSSRPPAEAVSCTRSQS